MKTEKEFRQEVLDLVRQLAEVVERLETRVFELERKTPGHDAAGEILDD